MRSQFLPPLIIAFLAALCGPAVAQLPGQASAGQQRLEAALARLAPQRPGVVDAYVVVVSLNGDPVFGREAREAGRVLSTRFDAAGRTVVLAQDEGPNKGDAAGSPTNLAFALVRASLVMDRNEDVLVLYTTSHGSRRDGLIYQAAGGEAIDATVRPRNLSKLMKQLGIKNRLVILQACYSGQFIPALKSDSSVVITAASADRASFGCTAGNDWTFFGHAFVNLALRKPAPLEHQFAEAAASVSVWEKQGKLDPSKPRISIGKSAGLWLGPLQARAPGTATAPVGRPPEELR